ncbi:hypothetical protein [Prevotella melaninogenica]|nr:hypothetical protein [Prevotella melaninogenica]
MSSNVLIGLLGSSAQRIVSYANDTSLPSGRTTLDSIPSHCQS